MGRDICTRTSCSMPHPSWPWIHPKISLKQQINRYSLTVQPCIVRNFSEPAPEEICRDRQVAGEHTWRWRQTVCSSSQPHMLNVRTQKSTPALSISCLTRSDMVSETALAGWSQWAACHQLHWKLGHSWWTEQPRTQGPAHNPRGALGLQD